MLKLYPHKTIKFFQNYINTKILLILMKTDWEITQECKTLPVLHNPLLIEGLPGIGNVGKIAEDYLIEEIDAKLLYSFFSYKFPHSVFVNEKNLIEMPKLELYYKKFNSKTKRDI